MTVVAARRVATDAAPRRAAPMEVVAVLRPVGTVSDMDIYTSRVDSGYLVVVRVPCNARFSVFFEDDQTSRDVTDSCADLLLSGVLAAAARDPDVDQADDDPTVATLAYDEPLDSPGAPRAQGSFTVVSLADCRANDIDSAEVMPLINSGIRKHIIEAVRLSENETTPAGAGSTADVNAR